MSQRAAIDLACRQELAEPRQHHDHATPDHRILRILIPCGLPCRTECWPWRKAGSRRAEPDISEHHIKVDHIIRGQAAAQMT